MTVREELQAVAREQNRDAELPDSLLADILALAEAATLPEQEPEFRKLIGQLRNFDLYAGAACFSETCSVKDISETLKRISNP
ncbi:MAG: hypothetical protein PHN92_06335 [Geobacter sp.]|nr:hypothetical protein [Geobacter sp.]